MIVGRASRAYSYGRPNERVLDPGVAIGWKLKNLAQHARRQRRDRIDPQQRLTRPADHFVGDADQPFLVAAEERPDQRQLPEQIVGP